MKITFFWLFGVIWLNYCNYNAKRFLSFAFDAISGFMRIALGCPVMESSTVYNNPWPFSFRQHFYGAKSLQIFLFLGYKLWVMPMITPNMKNMILFFQTKNHSCCPVQSSEIMTIITGCIHKEVNYFYSNIVDCFAIYGTNLSLWNLIVQNFATLILLQKIKCL